MTKTAFLAILHGLALPVFAQVVESPPAGFSLTDVAAGDASGPGLSFKAPGYLCDVVHAGIATSIGTDSLSDATAQWTDGLYDGDNGTHYVEITSIGGSTSQTGVGATRTILATSEAEKKLTFTTPLPPGISAPVGYRVVKNWTIAALFGAANSAGLRGGDAIGADMIQLWDGSSYESYYYQTSGIGGTGWRKVGDQINDAGTKVIQPGQAIIIRRGDSTPLTLFLHGQVKNGRTPMNIVPGFNFLANPYAVPMTLASCGIYTGDPLNGLAGGNLVTADQVLVTNGTTYQTYYYQKAGIGGTGWRRIGDLSTDAGGTQIPAGSSIIVWRLGKTGFEWTVPQHPGS